MLGALVDYWLGEIESHSIGVWSSNTGYGVYYQGIDIPGIDFGLFADNDIITIAVDITQRLFWARRQGGNWNDSLTADPDTDTGGFDISGISGAIYAAVGNYEGVDSGSVNLTGPFTHADLTTFLAWNGAAI